MKGNIITQQINHSTFWYQSTIVTYKNVQLTFRLDIVDNYSDCNDNEIEVMLKIFIDT